MNKKLMALLLAGANVFGISHINAEEHKTRTLSEASLAQLNKLFKGMHEIGNSINTIHCEQEYETYSDREEKFRSKWGEKLPRIVTYYKFNEFANKKTRDYDEQEPSENECLAALSKAHDLIEKHAPILEEAYKALPAEQKEEKEPPTDWKKEMQEIYNEQLETD